MSQRSRRLLRGRNYLGYTERIGRRVAGMERSTSYANEFELPAIMRSALITVQRRSGNARQRLLP
jgi:hypothetical protein